MADGKKTAARHGRLILFVDESGLSERPCRVTTWSRRGITPVLRYQYTWGQLSVIAAVGKNRLYFASCRGTYKAPAIARFLRQLLRRTRRKLLVVWDRLQGHRSKLVADLVHRARGRLQLAFLPAYAPELNPTELVWAHLKNREVGNYCPATFHELADLTRRRLKSMQRRPDLLNAFIRHTGLA